MSFGKAGLNKPRGVSEKGAVLWEGLGWRFEGSESSNGFQDIF